MNQQKKMSLDELMKVNSNPSLHIKLSCSRAARFCAAALALALLVPATHGAEAKQHALAAADGALEKSYDMKVDATINAAWLPVFKKFLAADNRSPVHTMLIRSPGGQVNAALDIAELMHSGTWDITVQGFCVSACASYIFPAARNKIVLPGSVVGIHSKKFKLSDSSGKPTWLSGNEIDVGKMIGGPHDALVDPALQQIYRERRLYNSLGISDDLPQVFDDYVTRRKRVLGLENVDDYPGTPECPRLTIWALSKPQLESMGVKGIGAFWYPTNETDRQFAEKTTRYPPGTMFFGEAKQLKSFCNGEPIGWLRRMWLLHGPTH